MEADVLGAVRDADDRNVKLLAGSVKPADHPLGQRAGALWDTAALVQALANGEREVLLRTVADGKHWPVEEEPSQRQALLLAEAQAGIPVAQ